MIVVGSVNKLTQCCERILQKTGTSRDRVWSESLSASQSKSLKQCFSSFLLPFSFPSAKLLPSKMPECSDAAKSHHDSISREAVPQISPRVRKGFRWFDVFSVRWRCPAQQGSFNFTLCPKYNGWHTHRRRANPHIVWNWIAHFDLGLSEKLFFLCKTQSKQRVQLKQQNF